MSHNCCHKCGKTIHTDDEGIVICERCKMLLSDSVGEGWYIMRMEFLSGEVVPTGKKEHTLNAPKQIVYRHEMMAVEDSVISGYIQGIGYSREGNWRERKVPKGTKFFSCN